MNREHVMHLIKNSKLVPELKEAAEQSVKYSIRICHEPTDKPVPVGKSKFGGLPDVPPDFQWPWVDDAYLPYPAIFVCQINLKDVFPLDPAGLFPSYGMLYFFEGIEDVSGNFSPVVYHPSDLQLTPAIHPEEDPRFEEPGNFEVLKESTIAFKAEWMIPPACFDPVDTVLSNLDITQREQQEEIYCELQKQILALTPAKNVHRMLGYADVNHWDPVEYSEYRNGEKKSWILLLQVNSDYDIMVWGDAGSISFWIDPEALKERDFSSVKEIWEQT